MKTIKFIILSTLFLVSQTWAQVPYDGAIFVDPDIITQNDPSAFQNVQYTGQAVRSMYDRRVNNTIQANAYIFKIQFNDGLSCEAVINPEFGSIELAAVEANKYGRYVGQLPYVLRKNVYSLTIHKGKELFGGGYRDILIHTGQSDDYLAGGILEETLVHEASHVSLDAQHSNSSGWIAAQKADVISHSPAEKLCWE